MLTVKLYKLKQVEYFTDYKEVLRKAGLKTAVKRTAQTSFLYIYSKNIIAVIICTYH